MLECGVFQQSDCCGPSLCLRFFNFSYIFFPPMSYILAWLLFFHSSTQESPTRKEHGRAWTSSSCHLCSFSSVLFLSRSSEKLLIKFAAARWFKHGGCAEICCLSSPKQCSSACSPTPSWGECVKFLPWNRCYRTHGEQF